MQTVKSWSNILINTGYVAMLVGAIDPMEGAFVILPGSGLVLLGNYLAHRERRLITYRLWIFIMITAGVAALFGMSMLGGIGGPGQPSMWWGLTVMPYLVGWSMGIWGPGSPRWVLWLGLPVSAWYLAIFVMTLKGTTETGDSNIVGIVICAIGILTICGCIYQLSRQNKAS